MRRLERLPIPSHCNGVASSILLGGIFLSGKMDAVGTLDKLSLDSGVLGGIGGRRRSLFVSLIQINRIVPSKILVIRGSSALKLANTFSNWGMTKTLMTPIAPTIAINTRRSKTMRCRN